MCTIDRPRGKPFCADGCPVPEGNATCGETRTLDIINEFKRLYEKKMEEIDTSNCGDCLQEKLKLQFDWINDLTEQNEMLVKAVEELEMEATERVKMLEDKLQKSAECICEGRQKLKQQTSHIHHLERKTCEVERLSEELKSKKEECESLQKNMVDMRQALTEEVATKHDVILKLKREYQELEERCIQADKQTAFRDDIIKGLRKEIKQLKQQITSEEVIKLNKTVDVLQNALERGKLLHEEEAKTKSAEISKQNRNIQELEKCVCTLQNQLQIKHGDISTLSNRIKELERYGNDLEQENPETSKDVDLLQDRIRELENYTSELQSKGKLCKVCKQNVRVSFTDCSEVQTDAREPTHEQLELLLNRDELIKYQSSTLEKMQQELDNVCEREKQLLTEKQTFCKENCLLQNKLLILERKLNEAEKTAQEISNKEEIIKKQKEALNLLQREAECLRTAEAEMRTKNQDCCACIQQLKNKVNDLEISVENAEKRGNNLQTAVDLYMNTINVLEATEDKYKLEIDNQRTTIANIQDVLVTTKQELDEYKQKYDDSVSSSWSSWLGLSEPKPTTPTNHNKKTQKPVHDI